MPEAVQPAGWPVPTGYTHGVLATGRLLAISGQVGAGMDGHMVSKDFVRQYERALQNVFAVVEAAGGSAADVVSMTVYVEDKLQFLGSTQEVAQAWQQRAGGTPPAMSLVEVKGLITPGAVVEIQALAVLPPAPPAPGIVAAEPTAAPTPAPAPDPGASDPSSPNNGNPDNPSKPEGA
jgi:enamine deaminase RidA (YjgF/YER057c/UK114 family)